MPLPALCALGDLNPLVQQQFSVLHGEAVDKGTLLHRHAAERFLPKQVDRNREGG